MINLVLGGVVLFDSSGRKVNRLFFVLCLFLSSFGVTLIGLNFSNNPSTTLLWSRLYNASLLFCSPLFYHFVMGTLGNSFKTHESKLADFFDRLKQLAYVFCTGWLVLIFMGIVPISLNKDLSIYLPVIQNQEWVGLFLFGILLGTAFVALLRQYLVSHDPTHRSRMLFILIGTGTMMTAGIVSSMFFYIPHFQNFVFLIPLSHFLSTIGLAFIAYCLTTSHLYHISELIRKTLAFFVMTTILLTVFGGTHFLAAKLLVPYIPRSDFFALGMASIIMALLFHPLRFRVQNMVDKVFFRQSYDQMQRLRQLSRRVLSSADRDELLNILFSSLKGIGFNSVSLLLKDPQKPIFHIKKGVGLNPNSEGFFLKTDSLLIQHVREEKEEVIRDEVTRRILTDWERQSISDEMEILQSEIAFPLFSTRRRALFGVITLGNSELGYSSYKGRNVFWLKSVIDNAGIMLDNFYHQELANALIPYVGKAWATEMRRNKEGFRERLSGHRTWVSVLMVDIRHFTPMSARLDPKDVVELLKEFRSRVAPVVYRYQGTIDKFIGDAIMIVFGLPILPPLPNQDKNAVECALEIMREIEALNIKRYEESKKEPISIGIGVSSGEVIAGNVDSGDRVEYTVIGDAANMVARLEDLAGDNQILCSPATFEKVREHVIVNPWKPRYLTGFEEQLVVYELLGMVDGNQTTARTDDQYLAANQ
ncbi:MAG: adenylate/guanylate cyclase domain-containing protein [Elusimicrobiota bacterium]